MGSVGLVPSQPQKVRLPQRDGAAPAASRHAGLGTTRAGLHPGLGKSVPTPAFLGKRQQGCSVAGGRLPLQAAPTLPCERQLQTEEPAW